MANYKRMLSYLYVYENGVKKKNIGYVKLECRDNVCKINIEIQNLPSSQDEVYKAYLIKKSGGKTIGIPIGTLDVDNGRGSLKVVANSRNLMDSGATIDEIIGVIVVPTSLLNDKIKANKIFSTDLEGNTTTFEVWKNPMRDSDKQSKPSKERKPSEELPHRERQPNEAEPPKNEQPPSVQPPTMPPPEPDKVPDHIERRGTEQPPELTPLPQPTPPQQPTPSSQLSESDTSFFDDIPDDCFKKKKAKDISASEINDSVEKEEEIEPVHTKMFKEYPKMSPFEGYEIEDCIRIEPRDIALLPIGNWVFMNNYFLLNGFYQFKHLILAKKRDIGVGHGHHYILGVPGVYYTREKNLADAHGFKKFVCVKNIPPKAGEFGYWYVEIKL